MKKYRLLLINPAQQRKYKHYTAMTELGRMMGKKKLMIPLALPVVASLTPDNYAIEILDEELQPLPKELPDIVGISTLGPTMGRACEVADLYRAQGVPVVLGGPHASYSTAEALAHCDAVVVGEAEGAWPQCLADFERGELKQTYRADTYCSYDRAPMPRWDLLDSRDFFQVGVQASRGCPFKCDFCLVPDMYGRKMRYRDVDNVVEELKALPVKNVFFVDDNFTANKKQVRRLLPELKRLNISWACQTGIAVAKDPELLEEMAEAGCFNILIGFESLNAASLGEVHKRHNRDAEKYEDAIRKIHAAGIHINASFIIGFDHDILEAFDQIFDFCGKNNLSYVNLNLLGAVAGTALYERYQEEGRVFAGHPALRGGNFPRMHYYNMSQREIFDKFVETATRLYHPKTIHDKAIRLFGEGHFTRPFSARSSFWFKLRITLLMVKECVFTFNRHRRRLFFHLIALTRQRRVSIDRALSYLLSMIGFEKHLKYFSSHLDHFREMIQRQDRGPWRELPPADQPRGTSQGARTTVVD